MKIGKSKQMNQDRESAIQQVIEHKNNRYNKVMEDRKRLGSEYKGVREREVTARENLNAHRNLGKGRESGPVGGHLGSNN
jgi:hypothetical protein